jgi:hypothetical protein
MNSGSESQTPPARGRRDFDGGRHEFLGFRRQPGRKNTQALFMLFSDLSNANILLDVMGRNV